MTPASNEPGTLSCLAFSALSTLVILFQGCATTPLPPRLAAMRSRPLPSTPEAVAEEIAFMVEFDQEARFAMMDASGRLPEVRFAMNLQAIDHANTERMIRVVDRFGWPTVSKFGKETAQNAWLVVQHADAQPDFQRRCLDLMTPHVAKGEVTRNNYAYLTDRVLLAEGQEQVYGTQFETVNGIFQPRPLIDPGNVDKRRKAMGLVSLKEYKTWFKH